MHNFLKDGGGFIHKSTLLIDFLKNSLENDSFVWMVCIILQSDQCYSFSTIIALVTCYKMISKYFWKWLCPLLVSFIARNEHYLCWKYSIGSIEKWWKFSNRVDLWTNPPLSFFISKEIKTVDMTMRKKIAEANFISSNQVCSFS